MKFYETKDGMIKFIRNKIKDFEAKTEKFMADLEDGEFEFRSRLIFKDTEDLDVFVKEMKELVEELEGDVFECKQVDIELRLGFTIPMSEKMEESYSINEAYQFADIKADLAAAKEIALSLSKSKKKSLTGKKNGKSNYSYSFAKDYDGIPTVYRTEFLDWGNGLLSTKSTLKSAFIFVINGFVYYPKSTNRGIVPGVKGQSVDEFKTFIVSNKD